MRIAFVYDALHPEVSGGGERRVHEIGRRLAARHDVTHVTWQWWDGPSTIERDGMTLRGVGPAPGLYGRDGKRTIREAAAFAARLFPILARGRWDVVECSATPYLPLYAAWAATRITRTPLVATWHEFWGDHWHEYLPQRPVVARGARALEAGARPLGDAVVAVSEFTMARIGRAAAPNRRVIPNGVGVPPRVEVERLVDVAFVGRLIDEKRADLLIDAVAELVAAGRRVRCVIAGDGPARADLERHAAVAGVAGAIEFPGRIEEAARDALLAGARVVVQPSLREGFGISVIEAQAAGAVPVVVRGPHTAASDLVDEGVNGVTCDANCLRHRSCRRGAPRRRRWADPDERRRSERRDAPRLGRRGRRARAAVP